MTDLVDILWRVHNEPGAGHEALLADAIDHELSLAEGQRAQLALLPRVLFLR